MPSSDTPDDTGDRSPLLTLKEACQVLDVSLRTIYRLGKAGELELIKLGGRTRVTRASIDNHIKNAKRVFPK